MGESQQTKILENMGRVFQMYQKLKVSQQQGVSAGKVHLTVH